MKLSAKISSFLLFSIGVCDGSLWEGNAARKLEDDGCEAAEIALSACFATADPTGALLNQCNNDCFFSPTPAGYCAQLEMQALPAIAAGCCASCSTELTASANCVLGSPVCLCDADVTAFLACSGIPPLVCSGCGFDLSAKFTCANWPTIEADLQDECCDSCNAEALTGFTCIAEESGCLASPPEPAPTPTPAPAPTGGGSCFSETATVKVLHKGTVAMKDLQVNDQVFTGDNYEPVYAFGHLDTETSTKFLQITTNQISPLELTASHMVFVTGKDYPVQAGSIKVGDALQGADASSGLKVKKIKTVERAGLYAPLTPSGTLLVDGILASSYIALQDSHDTYLKIGGGWLQVAHSAFVHFYLTPFRLTCMGVSTGLCQVYTENGIPPYIDYGMKLVQWADQQHVAVQALMLGVTLPIVLPLAALESVFGAFTVIPLLAALSAMVVAMGAAKKKASLKVKVL